MKRNLDTSFLYFSFILFLVVFLAYPQNFQLMFNIFSVIFILRYWMIVIKLNFNKSQ